MASEIERKFPVRGDDWRAKARDPMRIRQGYLAGAVRASVRVRVSGERAWLNIKSAAAGVVRTESDYEIPAADAEQILDELCAGAPIEKTRYFIEHAGHCWEIDVFEGDNAGLVVAEIELNSEDQAFDRPPWAGREVSRDRRYYNAALAERPYGLWKDA